MTAVPFSFPSDDHVQWLVAKQRRHDHELEDEFRKATAAGNREEAFAVFLAMRIAGQMPPTPEVIDFLLALREWKPFALSLIALEPEQIGLAVNALLEADDPTGENAGREVEGSLGEFRSALALYVVQRRDCALPSGALRALAMAEPFFSDPHARACVELLYADGALVSPAAQTLKRFIDWAFESPPDTWMREHPESPLGSWFGRYPRPS